MFVAIETAARLICEPRPYSSLEGNRAATRYTSSASPSASVNTFSLVWSLMNRSLIYLATAYSPRPTAGPMGLILPIAADRRRSIGKYYHRLGVTRRAIQRHWRGQVHEQ